MTTITESHYVKLYNYLWCTWIWSDCCPCNSGLFIVIADVHMVVIIGIYCYGNIRPVHLLLIFISAKWMEWNWQIYCFHLCVCVCVCAHSVQSSTVCVSPTMHQLSPNWHQIVGICT